jgi:KaiC/GvpD/RAD55 family RecA-like ATPase
MTIKHAFMVTSAINTKFGVFSGDQRLAQTLSTVSSIKRYIPDARIILVEMGAIALEQDQETLLNSSVDKIINFNNDEDVQAIFVSDNWDVVKNTTEVMCFRRALQQCIDHNLFDGIDRIHKISGRYRLNDNFDPARYVLYPDSIITTRKHSSQFPYELTLVHYQYMSRLWSWPAKITQEIIDMYDAGLDYMAARLSQGGYCDIEHMLGKFLPAHKIIEIEKVGLEGNIGPNGSAIND